MDTLLLLCNLHADGPATWRRLVHRGVRDVTQLAAVDVDQLAEWLGGSPAGARRFLREARRLEVRVPVEKAVEETVAHAIETSRERARVELVPPSSEIGGATEDELAVSRATSCGLEAPRESSELLRPGGLAGLDRATCERLVAEGIRTLEQLVRAPNERLAAATSLDRALLGALQRDAAALVAVAAVPRARPSPSTTRWSSEAPEERGSTRSMLPGRSHVAREVELAPIDGFGDVGDVAGPFA